jgi:hypothetical protein
VSLTAPQSAPQGPQSSGQVEQFSLDVGSQVPSPQVDAGVHPAQVVRTPNTHKWLQSPVAG